MKNNSETCEFIPFAEEYITHIIGKTEYVRNITNMLYRLKRFEKQRNSKLLTDSFTEEIVNAFIYFLQTDEPIYYRKHDLKATTINAYMRKLTFLLKRAERAGYSVYPYTIKKIKEDLPEPVYLTLKELKKIYAVKLSPASNIVRDMFLIGCYIGLRYSDYSKLTQFNFVGNEVVIRTQKTGEKVVIPLHPVVREIMKKYHDSLPALKSQQNFNAILKRICRRAGINTPIAQEYIAGTEVIKKTSPKLQLISTHTARRSFATNAYLAGIPVFRIMLITGHHTQESFFRYIRIRKEENAQELAAHPFFSTEISSRENKRSGHFTYKAIFSFLYAYFSNFILKRSRH